MDIAESTETDKMCAETLGMTRSLVEQFAIAKGEDVEFRSMNEMTSVEMLAEMQTILCAANKHIGAALNHPMLKPMLRMLGKG